MKIPGKLLSKEMVWRESQLANLIAEHKSTFIVLHWTRHHSAKVVVIRYLPKQNCLKRWVLESGVQNACFGRSSALGSGTEATRGDVWSTRVVVDNTTADSRQSSQLGCPFRRFLQYLWISWNELVVQQVVVWGMILYWLLLLVYLGNEYVKFISLIGKNLM